MKISLKSIGVLLGVILALTVVSCTIQSYLIPTVKVKSLSGDKLEKSYTGKGLMGYDKELMNQNKQIVLAQNEGIISSLQVQAYSKVSKGDILGYITPVSGKEEKLKEQLEREALKTDFAKLKGDKALVEAKYERILKSLENCEQKMREVESSKAMKDIEEKIKELEKDYAYKKDLYDVGVISLNEYETSKVALQKEEAYKEEMKKTLEEDYTAQIEELVLEKQQLESELEGLGHQLSLKEKEYELSQIEEEIVALIAPLSGYVAKVNVIEGMKVYENNELFTVVPDDLPYRVCFDMPPGSASLVSIGDEVTLQIGMNKRKAEIIHKEMNLEENIYTIKADLDLDLVEALGINPKEYVEATVEVTQTSDYYEYVVPLTAIKTAGRQAYIYVIEEQRGIWNTKYFLKEVKVKIIDDNSYNAAIEISRGDIGKVVLEAADQLQNGKEVHLE